MSTSGLFITLEGVDGCGKSTQIQLLRSCFEQASCKVLCLREPGGTSISEAIRALVLDPAHTSMSSECELLLYEAARAQLVHEVIKPALAQGCIVLCDRYFDSTYAYQYGGRKLAEDMVLRANDLGSCGIVPHKTYVLDVDVACAYARATKTSVDRLEQEGLAFQQDVQKAYKKLACLQPQRVTLISGEGTPQEVFSRLYADIRKTFPQLSL